MENKDEIIMPQSYEAGVIIVDETGKFGYKSLQEAVNAASPGQTIYVKKGIYRESVSINKSLIIEGESFSNTHFINVGMYGFVIEDAVEVLISNITINIRSGIGIKLTSNLQLSTARLDRVIISGRGLMGASYAITAAGKNVKCAMNQCTVKNKISWGIKASDGAEVKIKDSIISAVMCVDASDDGTVVSSEHTIYTPWSAKVTRGITADNKSSVILQNNSFLGFTRAIHAAHGAQVQLLGNKFEGNKIWCIYADDKGTKVSVYNNSFVENRPAKKTDRLTERVKIRADYLTSACIWAEKGAELDISSNSFENNFHCIDIRDLETYANISLNKFVDNRIYEAYDNLVKNIIAQTGNHVDHAVIVRNGASICVKNNEFIRNGICQVVVEHSDKAESKIEESDNVYVNL